MGDSPPEPQPADDERWEYDRPEPNPQPDAPKPPEGHTAAPSDSEPVDGDTRGPFIVARDGTRAVILRDGRRIELEPTMNGPNGAEMPRCQGIAIRLDADPSGAAAGQCSKPAVSGVRVCPTHGASAPQVIAAARRRLQGSALSLVERLLAIAEDPKAKDADALRAIDSALDRVGIPRRQELQVDSDQLRADIEERLAELEAADQADDTDAEDGESPTEPAPAETAANMPPDIPPTDDEQTEHQPDTTTENPDATD